MPKIAKSRRPQAERAGEHYLREVCGCVVTQRAMRTKWARVDLYASDVTGKRPDGSCVYAQVTAGQSEALRVRRRKLEAIPWHASETVLVLQLTSTEDPANRRRKFWWFRVHRYHHFLDMTDCELGYWTVDDRAESVPKEWFKAWKETDNG
jgi:hypothetical protein